ncbi:MAG: hypothetical protein IPM82_00655 [Saprospiraceae bacterium]|nr:hypothetical protein [Saprospiraceae bacterium]
MIADYLADVKEAIAWVKAHPEASGEGNAALYGLMARIPLRGMVKDNVRKVFLENYGGSLESETSNSEQKATGTGRWMGRLNRILAWLGR